MHNPVTKLTSHRELSIQNIIKRLSINQNTNNI